MTPTELLWQQIQRKVGVRPDGVPGPVTAAAVAEALGIEAPVSSASHRWPRDTTAEMVAFYGQPGTGHTQIVPPYQLYYEGRPLQRITVHQKIAEPVMRVLSRVLDEYGAENIRNLRLDVFDGCYNDRAKRGGTSRSVHAYAAALDFAAEWNPMHADHKTALFARPEYEGWFRAWEAEGAVSLGRARDFDYMHVQFARL